MLPLAVIRALPAAIRGLLRLSSWNFCLRDGFFTIRAIILSFAASSGVLVLLPTATPAIISLASSQTPPARLHTASTVPHQWWARPANQLH